MARLKKRNVEQSEKEAFIQEAQGWELTRQHMEQKSTRLAWRLCGVSWAISFVAVAGLAVMGPLKTVVPFVIQTDKTTGVVDVVTEMADSKTTYGETMDKFWLQNYVRYREGYSNALAKDMYNRVGLMSGPAESQRYYAWFNPKNPNSPLSVYKDFATVRITMKSVSFVKKDKDSDTSVALVRYIKEVERAGDRSISNWVATVTYKYVKLPMNEKDREINPVGFQVVEYRNDPEGAAFEVPAAAPAVQAAPVQKPRSAFPPSPSPAAAPTTPAAAPSFAPSEQPFEEGDN